MLIQPDKLLRTPGGKVIMSILLGLGLASLFRRVCKNKECLQFYAPPLEKIDDEVFKGKNGKCVKYVPIAAKCSLESKIVEFE